MVWEQFRSHQSPSSMRLSLLRCSKMLLLSDKDVRQCISMKDCVDINRKALASLRKDGGGIVPTRLGLPYKSGASHDAEDWSLFKPAAFYGNGVSDIQMGMKLVSVRANNPSQGLPLVPATVLLLDAATGIVKAVLNATYLTAARTAAGSAVATDLVCQVTPDISRKHMVVFGSGLQAECHIEAIRCIQPGISRITIVNRNQERADRLIKSLPSSIDGDVVLLKDTHRIKQALSDADIVITATNTMTPLFDGSWLKPGCHVNGIGSYTPTMQEVDETTVNRCRVLVDTPEALAVGDLKHISTEEHPWQLLGDLLNDPSWMKQELDSSIDCTFYKAVGTAIQDVMSASLVVQRASELGIGTEVDMS